LIISTSTPTSTHSRPLWRSILRLFVRLVNASAQLYALALIAFLLVLYLFGERWTPVRLVNSLMPNPLLPALVLCGLFLLLRRWLTVALLTPGVVVFVVLYGSLYLPGTPPSVAADAPRLRVMTYNIRTTAGTVGSASSVIRAANADIVGLQELHTSGARMLAAGLADMYPYHALHTEGETLIGVGLFSRYPIIDSDYWRAAMGNQRVEVDFNGQRVVVYNVHPPPPSMSRSGQLARDQEIGALLARSAEETLPTLLIGDFNTNDQNPIYREITARYRDSYREAGWGTGATFPNMQFVYSLLRYLPPVVRIDYIFHDERWTTTQAYVGRDSGGSDHYPVIAELALPAA
jgi:endonuclease/exonuclease/phosphatase (EEP) superfamily protein YafD